MIRAFASPCQTQTTFAGQRESDTRASNLTSSRPPSAVADCPRPIDSVSTNEVDCVFDAGAGLSRPGAAADEQAVRIAAARIAMGFIPCPTDGPGTGVTALSFQYQSSSSAGRLVPRSVVLAGQMNRERRAALRRRVDLYLPPMPRNNRLGDVESQA